MKHPKARFSGGSTWHDPEKVLLNITISALYILGLLAFQRYTGLMDWGKPVQSPSEPVRYHPQHRVYDAAATKRLVAELSPPPLPLMHGPIMRHLLSAQSDAAGAAGEELSEDVNGGEGAGEAAADGDGAVSAEAAGEAVDEVGGEKKAGNDTKPKELFPEDLFDLEARRQGWVVFYILGLVYMFVALAIVCDEFFVPALDVIIEVLGCSEDVAGATFMAAGGSAPELFTSVIGVFVAFSDVGIGTIVGSAVFNILFVIGMCALFSKTVLHLTWWPLFRDCTFYSVALITLILFFLDEKIEWYESVVLLGIYASYVLFMKFNVHAERAVKRVLYKNKVTRVRSTDHLVPSAGVTGAAMSGVVAGEGQKNHTSIPVLHAGSHFRHGLLQLMIHTIDPLHDGKVDEKATQLHAIASLKVLLDATKPQDGANGTAGHEDKSAVDQAHDSGRASQLTEEEARTVAKQQGAVAAGVDGEAGAAAANPNLDEVQPEPLDMNFPSGLQKQVTYILLFPIIFPLWLTLPDTRNPKARKFYPITFIGSILWIAAFSYLMVWWATRSGETFSIPPEVMGLTFLAAGTSIPDLITSVIVARKGFGDMAVSSSVGSNIFDVTVGLPLPWFLYSLFHGMGHVAVSAKGMVCSVAILFGMLCLVFFSILIFNWKMTKGMGFSMFIFYFAFVFVSLGFEYNYVTCPL